MKPVHIYNGDKLVTELVVVDNGFHPTQFGIKYPCFRGYYVRIISTKEFDQIIEKARAKGYEVYDYNTFD